MESKVMQVFYGPDCLPYKDSARSVHYPIVGNSFIGASNTTQIRFYVRDIGGVNNVSWVAISKLPNGKIGNEVLSHIGYDSELNEYYVALDLSSYYTQLKGDVYISLNGYQGGIQATEDQETGIYTIEGTPTIEATGSIKLSINYAPQLPLGQHFNISDLQQILGLISAKANVINTVQVVADVSEEDLSAYEEGQFFYDLATEQYYERTGLSPFYELAENGHGVLGSIRTLNRVVDTSGSLTFSQLYNLFGYKYFVVNYANGIDYLVQILQSGGAPSSVRALRLSDLHSWAASLINQLTINSTFSSLMSNTYIDDIPSNRELAENYVPYSGANENVDIGTNSIIAQHFYKQAITSGNELTTKDEMNSAIESAVETVKANAFIVVDTTTYPTLQDFLEDYPNPEEGYIYLYPSTVQAEGYLEYIWEGSDWLNIGTTQLDLSNYYTKPQANTKFVPYTGATQDINIGNHTFTSTNKIIGKALDVFQIGSTGSAKLTFITFLGGTTGSIYTPNDGSSLVFENKSDSFKIKKGANYEEIATENWVNANYVAQTNSGEKVYGTSELGEQMTYDVDSDLVGSGAIVRRETGTGTVVVGTPTSNTHATTKQYVDNAISNAVTSVYKIKGSATVSQINSMTNQQVGDVYNVTDSGTIVLGDLQVFTGDNIVWTGSAWDKLGAEIDWSAYDEKFIAAGFFEVQPYNESTGEITFIYSSELYIMSYDQDTGVMTIEAN